MARTGVNYFDIARAAESISQRGEEPTVDRVRGELGTGSKSTIAPLLKRWKAETGNGEADTGGLPRDLVDALKAVHQRVHDEADRKVDAVREEMATTVEQLRTELSQVRSLLAERTASLRDLEQNLQDSEEQGRNLRHALEDTQKTLAKSEFQCEESNTRVTELRAHLEELKQENRTVREHFEFYQRQIADDRQQERDQFRHSNRQLSSQISTLNEQLAAAVQKLAEREKQIEVQGTRNTQLASELQQAHQALAGNRAELDALRQNFAQQQRQLQVRSEEIGSLQEKIATLSSSNAAFIRESELQRAVCGRLETEIQHSREAFTSLNTEYQKVLQQKAELQGRLMQVQRTAPADA
ncbi:DNA-binding protein [Microbulbifer pacificus]|uniref:DNA-binding protein n=1 Tax=Microbulbifer pacificus TaxID=407164 RepID=UPI000CF4D90C|nr:DNA-binding protein [Microbulbifer pacificus]